mmetsp:Transcript_85146/g.162913  ORF Transcript_85146/g.162913 Transcript_85146/m.162913 type:complete len:94 (+) Transcript_85146:102-383(+)
MPQLHDLFQPARWARDHPGGNSRGMSGYQMPTAAQRKAAQTAIAVYARPAAGTKCWNQLCKVLSNGSMSSHLFPAPACRYAEKRSSKTFMEMH